MFTKVLAKNLAGVYFIICAQFIVLHANADSTPPQIVHDIITEQVADSNPYSISATVTDTEGVASVILHYKQRDAVEYKAVPMQARNGGSRYSVEIPAADLAAPGMDYFISAEDISGNKQFRGFDFDPLQVSVFAPLPVNNLQEQTSVSGGNRTLWYLVGAAVLAGVAASASSGGGGSSSASDTNTTTFIFER